MLGGRKGLAESGARKALQEKTLSIPAAAPLEFGTEVKGARDNLNFCVGARHSLAMHSMLPSQ